MSLTVNRNSNNNNLRLVFRVRSNGKTTFVNAPTSGVVEGQWIHVAAVYDGSHMIIYKDGYEISRVEKTGDITTNSLADVLLGNSPVGDRGFNGLLDDFRIYDRALTSSEVKILSGLYD